MSWCPPAGGSKSKGLFLKKLLVSFEGLFLKMGESPTALSSSLSSSSPLVITKALLTLFSLLSFSSAFAWECSGWMSSLNLRDCVSASKEPYSEPSKQAMSLGLSSVPGSCYVGLELLSSERYWRISLLSFLISLLSIALFRCFSSSGAVAAGATSFLCGRL